MLGRTLQAVSGLGSAAASLTPSWAKNGLKHLVCNIADVVAPPLPVEEASVTVEEQISEQLSSISVLLQQQQLNDGSDQATHAKLAIQYQLTRISQVLDERKRRAGVVVDDAAVAASITSSSSSSASSSISSSSDTDGTGSPCPLPSLPCLFSPSSSSYTAALWPCSPPSHCRHSSPALLPHPSRPPQRRCSNPLTGHSSRHSRRIRQYTAAYRRAKWPPQDREDAAAFSRQY